MNMYLQDQNNLIRMFEESQRLRNAFAKYTPETLSTVNHIRSNFLGLQSFAEDLRRQFNSYQPELTKFALGLDSYLRDISEALEPLGKDYQSLLSSIANSTNEIFRNLEEAARPLRSLQKDFNIQKTLLHEVAHHLHDLSLPLGSALSQISFEGLLNNINELQSSFPEYATVERDTLEGETVFHIEGVNVSETEVRAALDEVFGTPSNSDLLTRINEIDKKETRDAIVQIIITFLLFLASYVFPPPSLEARKVSLEKLKNHSRQISREINITHELRTSLRIVYTKSNLLVRESGYSKSEIVDSLQPGTVVLILEKNKKWSKISYTDPLTQESYTGWVFSRYLKKVE